MYTNREHCRALRLMFALRKEQAYFINLNGICLRLRPKGVQGASGKSPASGMIRQLCRNQFPVGGIDAPTLARVVGLPPRGGKYFLSKRKKVPKKASGTATPEAAHVASHCGQALRYACAWLRASWLSAISGASRPSASLGRGLRSAGAERLDAPNKFGASNSGP